MSNDKARNSYYLRTYGITLEDYNTLLASQNYRCAICLRHESEFKKKLAVDHRHGGPRKGEITGLLCEYDNLRVIGKHTDPDKFERAAAYLRQGTGWFVPVKKRKRRTRKKK